MGRSNLKKKKWTKNLEEEPNDSGVPIPNLPNKFLLMRVKSGTKIRNVLGHALKEFPNYGCVVWTSAGQGIGKAISCAELFKKKQEGLHQITNLRYVQSEKSKAEDKLETKTETRHVAEIHILLTKEVKDTTVPRFAPKDRRLQITDLKIISDDYTSPKYSYQAPDDRGEFVNGEEMKNKKKGRKQEAGGGNVTCIDAEEFAAMGLRTGQKRPKKEQQTGMPPRKSKKTGKQ